MKKLFTLFLLLSIFAAKTYSQDFNKLRDSLMEKQNEISNLYLKYKDIDVDKADKYLAESNRYFRQVVDLTIDYIEKNVAASEQIIRENLFMFDRDYEALSRVLNLINSEPEFNSEVKKLVQDTFDKVKGKRLIGTVANDFKLKDIDGNLVSLSDFKGQYIWVDFWASWCAPCRAKSREIVKHYDSLKKLNIAVVSLSFDDKKEVWLDASKKDGVCWTSLLNDCGFGGKIKDDYKIESLPSTFLIDKDMIIVMQNPSINEIIKFVSK